MNTESETTIVTEIPSLPEVEEFINQRMSSALNGLRDYVLVGLCLSATQKELPWGTFEKWKAAKFPQFQRAHLCNAKRIAESLAEMTGFKCPTVGHLTSLPPEIAEIVDGAGDHRALLATTHEYRIDSDAVYAKSLCEKRFEKDPALRDEWEPRVLSGELDWCQVARGLGGQQATKGGGRKDPEYDKISISSLITVRNSFGSWDKYQPEVREAFLERIADVVTTCPDAVLARLEQEIALRRRTVKPTAQ